MVKNRKMIKELGHVMGSNWRKLALGGSLLLGVTQLSVAERAGISTLPSQTEIPIATANIPLSKELEVFVDSKVSEFPQGTELKIPRYLFAMVKFRDQGPQNSLEKQTGSFEKLRDALQISSGGHFSPKFDYVTGDGISGKGTYSLDIDTPSFATRCETFDMDSSTKVFPIEQMINVQSDLVRRIEENEGIKVSNYEALIIATQLFPNTLDPSCILNFGLFIQDAKTIWLTPGVNLELYRFKKHEILHERGLGHAKTAVCRRQKEGVTDCQANNHVIPDPFDIMSVDLGADNINAAEMVKLGWIDNYEITKENLDHGPQTYQIQFLNNHPGRKSYSFRLPEGWQWNGREAKGQVFLEFSLGRYLVGHRGGTMPSQGLFVRAIVEGYDDTFLLDMHPNSLPNTTYQPRDEFLDSQLNKGESFTFWGKDYGIKLTVLQIIHETLTFKIERVS